MTDPQTQSDLLAEAAEEQKPRTVEQTRFDLGVTGEQIEAMWRQSVADNGQTMTYGERAKDVVSAAVTSLDGQWTAESLAKLKFIGTLLVLWEGSMILLGDASARNEEIIEARGGLLDVAQQKITDLQERVRALEEGLGSAAEIAGMHHRQINELAAAEQTETRQEPTNG